MKLVALSPEAIPVGRPLPFALRGDGGVLLAQKGYVIAHQEELRRVLAISPNLWLDVDESRETRQAYLGHLNKLLLSGHALGALTAAPVGAEVFASPARADDDRPDWPELQLRATRLLTTPLAADFGERFKHLHDTLVRNCIQAPDATLFALIYLSAQETAAYSATHAMLVACTCMIVAHEVLRWPDVRTLQVGRAALTMNIAMTALQDQLAQQTEPLSAAQIAAIAEHPERSAALLRQLGVADPVWLEAVRCHHQHFEGPLEPAPEAQQLARLIQRADQFAARIAPRATRAPMDVAAAMRASYFDGTRQPDALGAAIVKALGIYPPGTFVRLARGEIAVVLRRGASANTPPVAVVLKRDGLPPGEPIPRDSAQPEWKIIVSVPQESVRAKQPLATLLALVRR